MAISQTAEAARNALVLRAAMALAGAVAAVEGAVLIAKVWALHA